ncbi:MAG: carbamoyltransferase HypF, partial [Actinobacteria bacterium]|nr:carbamoyltransferase HypF [Actinomycetota bacterium]
VSQHIGDLENIETLDHFENTLALYKRLFRIEPKAVVHDLHPEYLSTKYARELPLPLIGVQHHHAHVASCLAENGITEPAIGVSFDGTGYGADGAIWGGEFLLADLSGFERRAHLSYVRMPGGAEAIKKPYRMALGYLYEAYGKELLDLPLDMLHRASEEELKTVVHQIERDFNSPLTSSAGRLFDAVAALVGVRDVALYEGQAAVELEAIAKPVDRAYAFEIVEADGEFVIETAPLIRAIVSDLDAGAPAPAIAWRFHRAVAEMIVEVCGLIRAADGNNTVALSGGVFQNALLFGEVVEGLGEAGFNVIFHRLVPANDGGVSLGQAVIASLKED